MDMSGLSSGPVSENSLLSFVECLRLNMPRLEVLKMVNWVFRQVLLPRSPPRFSSLYISLNSYYAFYCLW